MGGLRLAEGEKKDSLEIEGVCDVNLSAVYL
jgi:hypothetical protein